MFIGENYIWLLVISVVLSLIQLGLFSYALYTSKLTNFIKLNVIVSVLLTAFVAFLYIDRVKVQFVEPQVQEINFDKYSYVCGTINDKTIDIVAVAEPGDFKSGVLDIDNCRVYENNITHVYDITGVTVSIGESK